MLLLPTLRLPLNDDADNARELPMRRAMSWLDFREMEDGVEDDRDILPEVASDCSPSIFYEAPKDDNIKLVEKKTAKELLPGRRNGRHRGEKTR